MYVATFPTQWSKQFHSLRGFTEATTYESIDEFIDDEEWQKTLKVPTMIYVDESEKYPKITNHSFLPIEKKEVA